MDSAVLKEVLRLSPGDRVQIIDALWESLDPLEQSSIDEAWLRESEVRLDAFRNGTWTKNLGDQ